MGTKERRIDGYTLVEEGKRLGLGSSRENCIEILGARDDVLTNVRTKQEMNVLHSPFADYPYGLGPSRVEI
jgi:hypothetical protein